MKHIADHPALMENPVLKIVQDLARALSRRPQNILKVRIHLVALRGRPRLVRVEKISHLSITIRGRKMDIVMEHIATRPTLMENPVPETVQGPVQALSRRHRSPLKIRPYLITLRNRPPLWRVENLMKISRLPRAGPAGIL